MNFTKLLQSDTTAEWIKQAIAQLSPYPYVADVIIFILAIAIGSFVAILLHSLLRRGLCHFCQRHFNLSTELKRCIRNMSFALVSCVPFCAVIYCMWVDGVHAWVAEVTRTIMEGLIILSLAKAMSYGIRTFGLWYKQLRNAEQRPIDGLLRVAEWFVWAGAAILFVSVLLNKSPVYLLSGLGATAAVLMLFFQQAILSVVASVQVNTDHLVEIGDWIAMESGNVDGVVEEITLHTVKVRNWDMTMVCLPVRDLVTKTFVNYSSIEKNRARRIKKALLIDQRSIRFLTKDEVKMLKGFDILKNYLNGKEEQITHYNTGRSRFNTLHMTNLGTFRMYAQHYLEHNPHIRNDMPLIVRELAPSNSGIPLEIYCFSNEVSWIPYEKLQSDIIEHLLSIMPTFRLRVFQQCSDIYQEVDNQVDMIGGAFEFERFKSPRHRAAGGGGRHGFKPPETPSEPQSAAETTAQA